MKGFSKENSEHVMEVINTCDIFIIDAAQIIFWI